MSSNDEETTRQTAWVVSGILLFLATLMVLIYKSCDVADERRLECVKLGKAPAECDALFRYSSGGGK